MAKRTIRYLRKTGSEKSKQRRKAFAKQVIGVRQRDLRSMRGEKYVWHKLGGRDNAAVPYRFKGDAYRGRKFFSKRVLGKRIPNHLGEVIERKGKARILDIGSGKGAYWVSFTKSFGEDAAKIELHTLNPSNYFSPAIPTERKRQHVGAVETKNLAKFGRFDAITTFYAIGQTKANFNQVINKLSKSLSKNGKLFVIFGHKGMLGDLSEAGIKKSFGKNYRIDFLRLALKKGRKTFNNALVVTRTK